MNITYEQLNTLHLDQRWYVAEYVAAMVCAEAVGNAMKHVTAEELLERPFSLVAFDTLNTKNWQIVGHVSADGAVVGALWTDERYRGLGIGKTLVSAVTTFQLERGLQPEAFCNPKSVGVFAQCGYEMVPSSRVDRTKMLCLLSLPQMQYGIDTILPEMAMAS